jgi:hypothetical protein
MAFGAVKPYPEWKQLLASIEPLLETKKEFTYDELRELAGIDVRTDRGRQQFYKFRRVALSSWNIWLENIPGTGYIVIPASDHPKAAVKRVWSARRKVRLARAINELAKREEMTSTQLLLHAQTAALLEDIAQTFNTTGRKLAAVASKFKLEMSEEDLKALTDEPVRKKLPRAAAVQ